MLSIMEQKNQNWNFFETVQIQFDFDCELMILIWMKSTFWRKSDANTIF